jgi:hypothetical protein
MDCVILNLTTPPVPPSPSMPTGALPHFICLQVNCPLTCWVPNSVTSDSDSEASGVDTQAVSDQAFCSTFMQAMCFLVSCIEVDELVRVLQLLLLCESRFVNTSLRFPRSLGSGVRHWCLRQATTRRGGGHTRPFLPASDCAACRCVCFMSCLCHSLCVPSLERQFSLYPWPLSCVLRQANETFGSQGLPVTPRCIFNLVWLCANDVLLLDRRNRVQMEDPLRLTPVDTVRLYCALMLQAATASVLLTPAGTEVSERSRARVGAQ